MFTVHLILNTQQKRFILLNIVNFHTINQRAAVLCLILALAAGIVWQPALEQWIHRATLTLCEIWGYLQSAPRAFKGRKAEKEGERKRRRWEKRRYSENANVSEQNWVKWICSAVIILLTLIPFKTHMTKFEDVSVLVHTLKANSV